MKRLWSLVSLAALSFACSPASSSSTSDDATTNAASSAPTTAPEITIVPTTTTLPTVQPGTYDTATDLADFFAQFGGEEAFGQPAAAAVTTYLGAEDALRAGDPAAADELLDALWRKYPVGDPKWFNTPYSPRGAHLGSPTAYYGLRMLTEVTDQLLAGDAAEPEHIRLTVVLVGCSEGTQATTEEELDAGTGDRVQLTLDESLNANADEWFDQATWTFRQYVSAITGGQLTVDLGIERLPDLCVPVATTRDGVVSSAGMTDDASVWDAMPAEVTAATDMWWVLYPSVVPAARALADTQFVTDGMGLHPSGAPVFTSDDLWVVRKPAQLGEGEYTSVERRTYFAQWMQTEFFHHLFRAYPEFELEVEGNDWFDLDNWPDDFVGVMEPDYFAEALHKRLLTADVPLSEKLQVPKQ
ncbi:MAG: hypothetical protein K8R99_01440 [Actinomycetia bacterium]|nr:hypothetical protein [Actinomycetes bacterium]